MPTLNGKSARFRAVPHSEALARSRDIGGTDTQGPVRGITLRPVAEDDMPYLFRLFADPKRCHLWMQGRRVYDEREFHQAWIAWTGDMMGAKFIVESRGQPLGLIFEYSRSLEDGHTKVTTLLEEDRVGHGAGVVATVLMVDWLFQRLPLRKVYLEVYGYNARVANILRKFGLAEEGALKEARFWDGSFWDIHIFAACRDVWPTLRTQILRPPRRARRTETARWREAVGSASCAEDDSGGVTVSVS